MTIEALRNLVIVYMDARMTAPNSILKLRELALLVVVDVVISAAGPGPAVEIVLAPSAVVAPALVVGDTGAAVVPKVRQLACFARVTSTTRLVIIVFATASYSR